jgi:hypothetical protein
MLTRAGDSNVALGLVAGIQSTKRHTAITGTSHAPGTFVPMRLLHCSATTSCVIDAAERLPHEPSDTPALASLTSAQRASHHFQEAR